MTDLFHNRKDTKINLQARFVKNRLDIEVVNKLSIIFYKLLLKLGSITYELELNPLKKYHFNKHLTF